MYVLFTELEIHIDNSILPVIVEFDKWEFFGGGGRGAREFSGVNIL